MSKYFLHLIVFQSLFALNFNFSQNIPEVIIDGQSLNNGFLGGINYAITRWVDWDNDGDSDLMKMGIYGFMKI